MILQKDFFLYLVLFSGSYILHYGKKAPIRIPLANQNDPDLQEAKLKCFHFPSLTHFQGLLKAMLSGQENIPHIEKRETQHLLQEALPIAFYQTGLEVLPLGPPGSCSFLSRLRLHHRVITCVHVCSYPLIRCQWASRVQGPAQG